MRETVINNFPKAPGIPDDKEKYLSGVDSEYEWDAFHSLSMEGYKVTQELIERVSEDWNYETNEEDRGRDAMAARGYWQAFLEVKKSISKILDGENSGKIAATDHGEWFFQLFDPSVAAGLLYKYDLAGYRNHQVYIGNSKHVPLNVDAVRDTMPLLFELIENEPEASVRAVLGHFFFTYIHPYMDGNGRIGRFLMNAMLASGGYPWTIIMVNYRSQYMESLEQASVHQNIEPFAKFLGYHEGEMMKQPFPYLNDYHRQKSKEAMKQVREMSKTPVTQEEFIAQWRRVHAAQFGATPPSKQDRGRKRNET